MKHTEWYFHTVQKYRKGLNEINAKYDAQIEAKKGYAGSVGYEEDVKQIEQTRAAEIKTLRADCQSDFDRCLQAMQRNAQARPMTPPTPEQLALLQALQMREHLSRDELQHAANALPDCAVGLGILEELARKHEILGFSAGGRELSDSFINGAIREFTKSARDTLTLTRTNQRREHLTGTEGPHGHGPDAAGIAKFRIDHDPESAEGCADRWGGVPRNAYEAFCRAVDG